MASSGFNTNRYKFKGTYDTAKHANVFNDSSTIIIQNYKCSGGEMKYTYYNSADPWCIPSYIDHVPGGYTKNFNNYFGGAGLSSHPYGILLGSKPQFYNLSYTAYGDYAGTTLTEYKNNRYLKLERTSSSLKLYDFGKSDSTPSSWDTSGKTVLKTFTVTYNDGTTGIPDRLIVVIQAAGGGGGGTNTGGWGVVDGAGGGGSGALGIAIIDTTINWYIRVGKAGFGGYGSGDLSTYGYAACIADTASGLSGSGSSYLYCGGGNAGGANSNGAGHDAAGGSGGLVSYNSSNSKLWYLSCRNGTSGGTLYHRGEGKKFKSATWGGSFLEKTFYCTNVESDKKGSNALTFSAKDGGKGKSYCDFEGAGGGASSYANGGDGGQSKGESGHNGNSGSGGGGCAGNDWWAGNNYGGDGGRGFIRFYS